MKWKVAAISAVVALVVGVGVAVNFGILRDLVMGVGYEPTSEMAEIRENLELTEQGLRIFNASRPELNERGDFNRNCRADNSEAAVLGCYTGQRIYIYGIDEAELAGVEEVTAAHELLHAVYERMSEAERAELVPLLERAYEQNPDILKDEIMAYEEYERAEELYVRVGTELVELPEGLERHYGEIFRNQDKIARYYYGYIEVFQEIEQVLGELAKEMQEAKVALDARMSKYERAVTQLQADIVSFNACAETPGCFETDGEFEARRREIMNRREELTEEYVELEEEVVEYNALVDEYNAGVLHGQMLNSVMNSTVVVE